MMLKTAIYLFVGDDYRLTSVKNDAGGISGGRFPEKGSFSSR